MIVGCLALLPSSLIAQQPAQAARGAGEIVVEHRTLRQRGDSMRFELGTLYVPENRDHRESRIIGVGFARFRALDSAKSALTPPIFILPGGPGFSYLDGNALQGIMGRIALYRKVGDVVIVDQRGYSPRGEMLLFSGPQPREPLGEPASRARAMEAEREIAQAAVAHAKGQGWDLAGYTVIQCADDVNDLRQALGYPQIALAGASFGSQWSLAIMRRHPTIVARALLSGVVPLDHAYPAPSAVLAALGRMAHAVDQDSAFRPHLPPGGVMAAARVVLDRLERQPVTIGKDDSTSGEMALVIGAEDFRRHVPAANDASGFAHFVLTLYHRRYTELASQVAEDRSGNRRPLVLIWELMQGSAGVTPRRLHRLRSDTAAKYLGEWKWGWGSYLAGAGIWPTPDVGDDFRTPVKTDIPVVFVQGDWDATTPIENALEIAPFFPRGHVLVVKRGGHGVIDEIARHHPIVMEQLLDFLRTGTTAGLPAEVTLPMPKLPAPNLPPPAAANPPQ
jgi:pimeloyl-ACP methyl ester carboxylesterase